MGFSRGGSFYLRVSFDAWAIASGGNNALSIRTKVFIQMVDRDSWARSFTSLRMQKCMVYLIFTKLKCMIFLVKFTVNNWNLKISWFVVYQLNCVWFFFFQIWKNHDTRSFAKIQNARIEEFIRESCSRIKSLVQPKASKFIPKVFR